MINEKLIEFSDQIDEAHVCKNYLFFCQMQCFTGLLKQKFTSLLCAFEA